MAEQKPKEEAKENNEADKKRVVLVTGASRGLGYLTALELHKLGFIVYAGVRKISDDKAKFPFKQIICDVTKTDQVKSCVETITKDEKGLDILINNAGIGCPAAAIQDTPMDNFRKCMEVNYFGVINITKECLPLLLKSSAGKIIMISSSISIASIPFLSAYTATKGALDRLSESLSAELSHTKISINVISPGPSATDFGHNTADLIKQKSKLYDGLFNDFFGNAPYFGKKGINVIPANVGKCVGDLLTGKIKDEFRIFPGCSKNVITSVLNNYNQNYEQNATFAKNVCAKDGWKKLGWEPILKKNEEAAKK